MPETLEALNLELLSAIAVYAGELVLRVAPMLVAAIFLAELARLRLGDYRLKRLLVGKNPLVGRLRAVTLGAVLPFCECGAFPVMLGLIRAGVPAVVVLTFFLVSPVVSMPAFLILVGVFGLPLALLYLLITSASALAGSFVLELFGRHWGIFKEGVAVESKGEGMRLAVGCEPTGGVSRDNSKSCCKEFSPERETYNNDFSTSAVQAWSHTWKLLRRIFPYMAAVIIVSALLRNLIPQHLIEQTLAAQAPFDVLIGALVGIPIYSGDCAMIALAAPLIGATGALGAGIAFIISGSGTSISGIIFMSSVFKRNFLIVYIFTVFCIAVIVGYLISNLARFI